MSISASDRTAPRVAVAALTALTEGRRRRARRRTTVTGLLIVAVVATFVITLMVGNTFYSPDQVVRVLLGQTVPGASFTIGELRLPRASLGLLAGLAFGMAGVTFQTMLRNPLASPDIIGISSGASAFAVVAIIGFSLSDAAVSAFALVGALGTAAAIYLLARRGAFTGTRLVLIGIGVAAMLDSVTTWVLTRAANWDLQTAMQWLTGSLNNASWGRLAPLAVAVIVILPLMAANTRGLAVLRLGDDSAAGLGVRVERTRLLLIVGAVVLLAFATAASGPIAFVAFMAGPIAARLIGPGGSLLLPAGLVGALLVMVSDLIGQFGFDNRYPVGVITGVLGAPYLIYLLIRTNRSGGSL